MTIIPTPSRQGMSVIYNNWHLLLFNNNFKSGEQFTSTNCNLTLQQSCFLVPFHTIYSLNFIYFVRKFSVTATCTFAWLLCMYIQHLIGEIIIIFANKFCANESQLDLRKFWGFFYHAFAFKCKYSNNIRTAPVGRKVTNHNALREQKFFVNKQLR